MTERYNSMAVLSKKYKKVKSSLYKILKKVFICSSGGEFDEIPAQPEPTLDIEDDDISVISLTDSIHTISVNTTSSASPVKHNISKKLDSSSAGSGTRPSMFSKKALPPINLNKKAEEVSGKVLPPVKCKKACGRKITLPPIDPAYCENANSLLKKAIEKNNNASNGKGYKDQSTSAMQPVQKDDKKNKQNKICKVPKPTVIIKVAEAPITERVPYQDTFPINFPPRPSTAVRQFLLSHTATSRECQKKNIQNVSETKETLSRERPLAAHPSRIRSMNMNVQEYIPYNQDRSDNSDSSSEDEEESVTLLLQPALLDESSISEQSISEDDICSKDVTNTIHSDPESKLIQVAEAPTTEHIPSQQTLKIKSVSTTSLLCDCPSPNDEIQNVRDSRSEAVCRDRPLAAHPSRRWSRCMNMREQIQEQSRDSDSDEDEEGQVTYKSQPTLLLVGESSTGKQQMQEDDKAVRRDRPLAAHPSRLRSRSMTQRCISYNQMQSHHNNSKSEDGKKISTSSQPLLCKISTDKRTKLKDGTSTNTEQISAKSIQVAQGPTITTERVSFHLTPRKNSVPAIFPTRPSTAVRQFLLCSSRTSSTRKPPTRDHDCFRERPREAHHSRLRSRITNVQEYIPYDQDHSDKSDSGSENELTVPPPQPLLLGESSIDKEHTPQRGKCSSKKQLGESSTGQQPMLEDIFSSNCCEPNSIEAAQSPSTRQSPPVQTCTASSSNLTKAFSAFPLHPLGQFLHTLDDAGKHHTEEAQNVNESRERPRAINQSRSMYTILRDDTTYSQFNCNDVSNDEK